MNGRRFGKGLWRAAAGGALAALALGAAAGTARPPVRTYIGTSVCKDCHPEAYKVWAGSSHARAFIALGTANGRKIGKDPNAYPGMPSEKMLATCGPCHALGAEVPKRERPKDLHPEDGVQCESCHLPGPSYQAGCRMYSPTQAADPLADAVAKKDGAAEKAAPAAGAKEQPARGARCMACHKAKPSHEVLGRLPFDFEKAWGKIEHKGKGMGAREE